MLHVSTRRFDNMQAILKGQLLKRATSIKKRNGRIDGFEVKEVKGVFPGAEERLNSPCIEDFFTVLLGYHLRTLVRAEFEISGNIMHLKNALLKKFPGLFFFQPTDLSL